MSELDVEAVLEQLSIQEKVGLTAGIDFWHTYPVERLNIPSLRMSDGPNGVRGTRFFDGVPGAVLPNGTALASTFDKDLLLKAGTLTGVECHHKGAHINLGPTANTQRGPNGGRGFESFSEDPYLAGMAAAHIVKGIQSQNVAATMKHYVCNDLEDERNASDSIVTERALREIYLEPFRLAVKYADPKAFMTGYNKVNGEHVSQSKKFIQDILHAEWGSDCAVMSDWFGTYTSKTAIENGLDIEMPGPPKYRTEEAVSQQVGSREMHVNSLNDRVRSILKLVNYAQKSGIPENAPEDADNNTPETAAFLRQIAADSIVLLKNEGNVLPIKKEEKVAVIGPTAKVANYSGGGSASLLPYYTVTPYEGITNKLGNKPPHAIGCHAHVSLPGLGPQLVNPETGNKGYRLNIYKEPRDAENRTFIEQKNLDSSLVTLFDYKVPGLKSSEAFYGDFEGVFIPENTAEYEFGMCVVGTARLFVDGKLVVDNKTKQTKGQSFFSVGTIEEKGRIKLEAGKKYNILVEFSSGHTYTIKNIKGVDFTGNGGIYIGAAQVIDAKKEIENAVSLAKSVDKVILNIGLNGEWESEGYDRKDLKLPGYTNDLVAAVIKANPNTVVVNQSGTPVEFPWLKDVKALVQAWFGGNELGNAIADVLYGDVNPSGKLSLSFPKRFEDNPAYLNFKTERGRVLYGEDIFVGYRFYEKLQREVAFPFGHGLSYTTFSFSDLKVSTDEEKDKLTASVKVVNTGSVAGKEVVQLYVSKTESDVIRPVKELKGFEKIELAAGESKVVEIKVDLKDSVSFFDEYENKWSQQAGEYQAQIGSSSANIHLRETFSVEKSKLWLGL